MRIFKEDILNYTKEEEWTIQLYKAYCNYNNSKAFFNTIESAYDFLDKCKGEFFIKPCTFKECSNYFGIRTRKLDKLLDRNEAYFDEITSRLFFREKVNVA